MKSMLWCIAIGLVGATGLRADDEAAPTLKSGIDHLQREVDAPALQEHADKDDDHRRSDRAEFTIGPMGGFLKARDADRGTWFGGVQARLRFLRMLAVEGSISFHQNEFLDGDVVVTQYPVQVSLLFLPFPDGALDPYVLAGAGWYYTRIDYDDAIGGGDETDRSFGGHVGAGTNLRLTPRISLFGDVRWVFMDEPGVDNSVLSEEKFDFWYVTFGLNIGF